MVYERSIILLSNSSNTSLAFPSKNVNLIHENTGVLKKIAIVRNTGMLITCQNSYLEETIVKRFFKSLDNFIIVVKNF